MYLIPEFLEKRLNKEERILYSGTEGIELELESVIMNEHKIFYISNIGNIYIYDEDTLLIYDFKKIKRKFICNIDKNNKVSLKGKFIKVKAIKGRRTFKDNCFLTLEFNKEIFEILSKEIKDNPFMTRESQMESLKKTI